MNLDFCLSQSQAPPAEIICPSWIATRFPMIKTIGMTVDVNSDNAVAFAETSQ
jgi:hypothetical protein